MCVRWIAALVRGVRDAACVRGWAEERRKCLKDAARGGQGECAGSSVAEALEAYGHMTWRGDAQNGAWEQGCVCGGMLPACARAGRRRRAAAPGSGAVRRSAWRCTWSSVSMMRWLIECRCRCRFGDCTSLGDWSLQPKFQNFIGSCKSCTFWDALTKRDLDFP